MGGLLPIGKTRRAMRRPPLPAIHGTAGGPAPGRIARHRTSPRSLVSINTGMPVTLASCRTRSFMSSESHSSISRSRPSRNARHRLFGEAVGKDLHLQVRVDLGDPPRGHQRLVDSDVEERRRHPVQVGQFEVVVVGQPQLTAQTLHRERVGDSVADAEPDDPDLQPTEPRLFGGA